jgi:hypothetical protein
MQQKFNSVGDQSLKQQLRLGSKRNVNEPLRQTIVLEVIKLTARSSVKVPKMSVKTLWRSWPPPKRKTRLLIAGVPGIHGSFACTNQKRRNGGKPVGYLG